RSPRPTMPVSLVQRNASNPEADSLDPTTTEPSPETPLATLLKTPPGKSPSPSMLPLMRNASSPEAELERPTKAEPLAATPKATLSNFRRADRQAGHARAVRPDER